MNVNLHINGIKVQCDQIKVGQFANREKIIWCFCQYLEQSIWQNNSHEKSFIITIIQSIIPKWMDGCQIFPKGVVWAKQNILNITLRQWHMGNDKFGYEKTYGGAIIILWVKLFT
jgi:hypothetical protein